MASSTGIKLFGMRTLPRKIGDFYSWMQKNAFNEINRIGMIWTVHHLWPSRDRFVFNFYRNWSSIVLQNGNGTAIFLHSREVVTQGDSLSMVPYGIGIIPLIKLQKAEFPDVTQTWYANNAGALGTFTNFELYFN